MTTPDDYELRRDRALDDLLDVDRQLAAGELSERDADQLRAHYQAEALAAIRMLAAPVADPQRQDDSAAPVPPRAGRRLRQRHLLYAAAVAVAVVTAVLVTRNVSERPPGGLVSGNLPSQSAPDAGAAPQELRPPRNLSKVTDAQMEAVVAANPEVLGMRLALAKRYAEKGRYDLAVVHYAKVLELDPENAEAQAHLGWINLQLGRPEEAARLVDAAVEAEPDNPDALWFQANVRLYGLDSPADALEALDAMEALGGLRPTVRRQIAALRAEASTRLEAP